MATIPDHAVQVGSIASHVTNGTLLFCLSCFVFVHVCLSYHHRVRDDLFNTNASIVKGIAEQCSKSCPKACFLIISNPVNSTVPIFADVLKVTAAPVHVHVGKCVVCCYSSLAGAVLLLCGLRRPPSGMLPFGVLCWPGIGASRVGFHRFVLLLLHASARLHNPD